MALNSPSFLFLFLPVFLITYSLAGKRFRSAILLIFSLVFYLWSEPLFSTLILMLIGINCFLARMIYNSTPASRKRTRLLAMGIALNLVSLFFFKLLAAYAGNLLSLLSQFGITPPAWVISAMPLAAHLPLGFSFLAFQAISLLVDVSRQPLLETPRCTPVFTYLLMFPKVIAGPIMRFRETAAQLQDRSFSSGRAAAGFRRFITGFAKKTLIADQLARITDSGIFNHPPLQIPIEIAWLVIICYTLQIYFDFSAYSDMAIGLGQVLGFNFVENFNYPYLSGSITEFWRRWHISLSNWFREYVFYPLERKRASVHWLSQPLNLIILFLLIGLWHGLTPPFVVWGLLQGSAIVWERGRFGAWLEKLWRPLQSAYALIIIMLGWVFFRSPTLHYAWNFLKALAGFSYPTASLPFSVFPPVSPLVWSALTTAVILSFPLPSMLQRRIALRLPAEESTVLKWARNTLALALFAVGIIVQAGTSYKPFIYGGF